MKWNRGFGRRIIYAMGSSVVLIFLAGAMGSQAGAAAKVDFPAKNKSIVIIVGAAAGGSSDVGARLLAGPMEKELGVRIVIENKTGAGWQVGLTALARSRPDGYTVGITVLPQTITIYLDPERKALFTQKSFQPLAMQVVDPGVIAVKTDSPIKTLKDLLDAARANPGKIKASATGILGDDHLAILQMEKLTGIQLATVQFEGSAPSMTALLGGHTDVYFGNIGDTMTQFRMGAVRVLGIMDKEESRFLPGVKTMESQGVKLYSSSSRGLSAPAGTPREIVEIFTGAIQRAMANEEHKKRMEDQGLTLRFMDPPQMAAYWAEMEAQVKPLVDMVKKK